MNRALRSEESIMFANNTPDSRLTYTDCKLDSTQSIAAPHLVWNGEQFQRSSLEPLPSVIVEIAMMPRTHTAFGCIPTNTVSHQSHHILVFADTGAQTCSSRPEIQKLLRYPDGCLMPTTHRIHGIANNWLHVKGVLFLRMRVLSRVSFQGRYDKLCMWQTTHLAYIYCKPP